MKNKLSSLKPNRNQFLCSTQFTLKFCYKISKTYKYQGINYKYTFTFESGTPEDSRHQGIPAVPRASSTPGSSSPDPTQPGHMHRQRLRLRLRSLRELLLGPSRPLERQQRSPGWTHPEVSSQERTGQLRLLRGNTAGSRSSCTRSRFGQVAEFTRIGGLAG